LQPGDCLIEPDESSPGEVVKWCGFEVPTPEQYLREALASGMADPFLFALVLCDPEQSRDVVG
jgi:hypothetical protein